MKLVQIICYLLFFQITTAQDAFVIKDVTLFDGDKVITKTSVLIDNGKIVKIAKRIKGSYEVIDGQGKFLMPALINAHVHCWGTAQLEEAAQAGILSLLDMHGMEPMQKFLVEAAKKPTTARFFRAGYAATAEGGHGTQYGFPVPVLAGPEDAPEWIENRVKAGVDYIKIIYEPWKNTHTVETVNALVKEAHKLGKKAVVHISNSENAYEVYQAGADGLVHLWRKGNMEQDQLSNMASRSFFITPTMLTNIEVSRTIAKKSEDEIALLEKVTLKEIKRVYDAGIPLLAGTDPPNGNINMGTDLYKELIYFSKAGIPNLDVLKTATSNPVKHYGLEGLGFVKEGYVADLLLLDKSPLDNMENLSTISSIWKAGVAIKR